MKFFKPLSSFENNQFYKRLAEGNVNKAIWGKDKRFSPLGTTKSYSVNKYFKPILEKNICADDTVLDIGCGSGMFLPIASPMCSKIVGIDLSLDMLTLCNDTIKSFSLSNVQLYQTNASRLPFADETFDVVYMVDVMHHVSDVDKTVNEVSRILKPKGRFIVFEPNKLNALLFLLCLMDRNEWGALRLGSKRQYKKIFNALFNIDQMDYSGLLIGPDGKLNLTISDLLNHPKIKPLLGWQNPKIYLLMTKK